MTGREKILLGGAICLAGLFARQLWRLPSPEPAELGPSARPLPATAAPADRSVVRRPSTSSSAAPATAGSRPALRETPSRVAAAVSTRGRSSEETSTPWLRMDLLDEAGESRVSLSGRNIFDFPPPPPPPPPPPSRQELELTAWQKSCGPNCPLLFGETYGPPPPPPPPPKPVPPPEPEPPPLTGLKYLGRFGPEYRMIAALMSDKEILNVREGDVIENKFVVRKIEIDAVEFGFVGFPPEKSKKLPLAP